MKELIELIDDFPHRAKLSDDGVDDVDAIAIAYVSDITI